MSESAKAKMPCIYLFAQLWGMEQMWKVVIAAATLGLSVLFPAQVLACPGPDAEVRTFLQSAPETFEAVSVVAKVEILRVDLNEEIYKNHSRVKVIEAIQGTRAGESFTVVSEMHSCARDAEIIVGETYYIAGKRNAAGEFHGLWKGWPDDLIYLENEER